MPIVCKYQGHRGLRSDGEESQCRAEAVSLGKFALGAAGGLSETLGDNEEEAPGERQKALGRIAITFRAAWSVVSSASCLGFTFMPREQVYTQKKPSKLEN